MSVQTAEKAAPRVSERGRRVPASPIRKLASFADAAKKRGVKVYHLNIGQPDLETPAPMRDRLAQIHDKTYAYTPSNGTPECLDFLVGYYRGRGVELTKSQVITTTGGSEAVLFAFMACCETGDEVLLVEPFYTNYRAFAAMGGIELTPIVTRAEDGFHLPSREEWEKAKATADEGRRPLQPEQPDRHRLHARGARHGRRVLPRQRPLPHRRRGLPRVRLRRPRGGERPLAAGLRGRRRRRRQPLQALQRLRHPARLPRHAQPRGLPVVPPHGAGAPLPSGTRAGDRARAPPSSAPSTSRGSSRSTASGATSSSRS